MEIINDSYNLCCCYYNEHCVLFSLNNLTLVGKNRYLIPSSSIFIFTHTSFWVFYISCVNISVIYTHKITWNKTANLSLIFSGNLTNFFILVFSIYFAVYFKCRCVQLTYWMLELLLYNPVILSFWMYVSYSCMLKGVISNSLFINVHC